MYVRIMCPIYDRHECTFALSDLGPTCVRSMTDMNVRSHCVRSWTDMHNIAAMFVYNLIKKGMW